MFTHTHPRHVTIPRDPIPEQHAHASVVNVFYSLRTKATSDWCRQIFVRRTPFFQLRL